MQPGDHQATATAEEKGRAARCSAGAFVEGPGHAQALVPLWLDALGRRRTRVLAIAGPASVLHLAPQAQAKRLHWFGETPQAMRLADRNYSVGAFEASVLRFIEEKNQQLAARTRQPRGVHGPAATTGLVAPGPAADSPAAAWAIVVDMDWIITSPAATANVSVWGGTVQRLVQQLGAAVLCVYHRRHLPERVLLAGLHAHSAVVTPEGCQPNPYQLPDAIAASAAARPRFDFWLGQLNKSRNPTAPRDATPAQGASAGLQEDGRPGAEGAAGERWKVRCFGGLRVYLADGTRVSWERGTAAARQVRCLFAFLLLRGAKGASSEELIAMLWTDASSPERAANRLHHTISGLRQALTEATAAKGRKRAVRVGAREHPYVRREDGRYVLCPPDNTWMDVYDFEQLCRQGGTLLQDGAFDEALMCLESALSLYTGDLFDGLPPAFVDSRDPDWCWSRRYWFREMSFKVHRDCASIYRQQGNHLAAIQHCQKVLSRDPACAMAHVELMRVYAAQGRHEALERQFRQYKLALAETDQLHPDAHVQDLYAELRAQRPRGRP